MTPKLSPDIANALSARPDEPLQVQGPGGKVFWIMSETSIPNSYDNWVDQQLKLGVTQADAGLSESWDVEAIKQEARTQHQRKIKN